MEMRASDCMKSFSCAQLFKTLSLSACLAFGFSFASHAQMQSSPNYQIAVQNVPDEIYGKRIVGQSFLNELYQSLGGKLLWQSEPARAELREAIKNSIVCRKPFKHIKPMSRLAVGGKWLQGKP